MLSHFHFPKAFLHSTLEKNLLGPLSSFSQEKILNRTYQSTELNKYLFLWGGKNESWYVTFHCWCWCPRHFLKKLSVILSVFKLALIAMITFSSSYISHRTSSYFSNIFRKVGYYCVIYLQVRKMAGRKIMQWPWF